MSARGQPRVAAIGDPGAHARQGPVNPATGLEDSERVTVAFLVAGAALERGREVAMS
jgi:hypothetical protein